MSASTHPAHPVTDNQASLSTPDVPAGAPRRTWQKRAPRVALMAGVLVTLALLLLAPLDALANYYERGNWICEDFEDMERSHRSEPDNVLLQRGYARCLIARDDVNRGDTLLGPNILHNIVDTSTHPARTGAAWMLASYLSSGGTFEDTIDENNINEAIEAYTTVLFFIDLDLNYPEDGNSFYEEVAQIELKTNYFIVVLYFQKFKNGSVGVERAHRLKSPSYKGSKDLHTYPEYAPYTIDSLEQVIAFADQCMALPLKRHFIQEQYKKVLDGCKVLKDGAASILPLERQLSALLNTRSCGEDVIKCVKYNEVLYSKLDPIVKRVDAELDKIFGS